MSREHDGEARRSNRHLCDAIEIATSFDQLPPGLDVPGTLAGLQAGQMVGGAILTETVFAWPGIGRLMFEALQQRDYNLLLGIFFFSAALVIVFNILTDLVYRLADPRIKGAS